MPSTRWKNVSAEKFDAVMAKRFGAGKCKKCNSFNVELVFDMSAYSPYTNTVRLRCKRCSYSTPPINATEVFNEANGPRIGTFVTERCLVKSIRQAIQDWEEGKEAK